MQLNGLALNHLQGRTVLYVDSLEDSIFIRFTDGTFVNIGWYHEGSCIDDAEVVLSTMPLDSYEHRQYLTEAEKETVLEFQKQQEKEKRERKQLDSLQKATLKGLATFNSPHVPRELLEDYVKSAAKIQQAIDMLRRMKEAGSDLDKILANFSVED